MELLINDKIYNIEPYLCSNSSKFPFYINLTNLCNAKCKFCLNECNKNYSKLDLKLLESILNQVSDKVSRFSVSGGEPFLFSNELESVISLLENYGKQIIINTNGSLLLENIDMINRHNITSIQLSRHHYIDSINNSVFGIDTISHDDLISLKSSLNCDLRINCLLIKGMIDSEEEIVNFLEKVSETDINSVGFISMSKVNEYARSNFIDYRELISSLGEDFIETLRLNDAESCSCTNNMYVAGNGKTMFVYFRYKDNCLSRKRSLFFDGSGLKEGY